MEIIENKECLKSPSDIRPFFEDEYYDHFECGQGCYQDEATVYVKIGTKHFEVMLKAEIGSQKQDRGDRLYWAESLESVEYCEIDINDINKEKRKHLEQNVTITKKQFEDAIKLLKEFEAQLDKMITKASER